MVNEQDIIIAQALDEYETQGAVSTTTFMAMTTLGLDAQDIIESFE
jgi:hypothetical protein